MKGVLTFSFDFFARNCHSLASNSKVGSNVIGTSFPKRLLISSYVFLSRTEMALKTDKYCLKELTYRDGNSFLAALDA